MLDNFNCPAIDQEGRGETISFLENPQSILLFCLHLVPDNFLLPQLISLFTWSRYTDSSDLVVSPSAVLYSANFSILVL